MSGGDTCGERYRSWESIATRFYRSQKADIRQQVLEPLQADADKQKKLDCPVHYIANYIAAYNNLGNLRQLQGKIPEAIADYEQALQLNPNQAAARCNLASAYLLQGNLEAAKAGYEETLRLNSNFYLAHLNLGKLHASHGENGLAERHFREVLRLKPDNADRRLFAD